LIFHDAYANDLRLGYLLSKEVDYHFNNFTLGFCLQVDFFCHLSSNLQTQHSPKVHIFRSTGSPDERFWLNSAWTAHGKDVRLPPGPHHMELASWHYRHCVINGWGSFALQPRLHPSTFLECEEDYRFADIYHLVEDDDYTLSSPPACSPFQ